MQNRVSNTYPKVAVSKVNVMIHLKCPAPMEQGNVVPEKSHQNNICANPIVWIGLNIFEQNSYIKFRLLFCVFPSGLNSVCSCWVSAASPCLTWIWSLICKPRCQRVFAWGLSWQTRLLSYKWKRVCTQVEAWGCCPLGKFSELEASLVIKHCDRGWVNGPLNRRLSPLVYGI